MAPSSPMWATPQEGDLSADAAVIYNNIKLLGVAVDGVRVAELLVSRDYQQMEEDEANGVRLSDEDYDSPFFIGDLTHHTAWQVPSRPQTVSFEHMLLIHSLEVLAKRLSFLLEERGDALRAQPGKGKGKGKGKGVAERNNPAPKETADELGPDATKLMFEYPKSIVEAYGLFAQQLREQDRTEEPTIVKGKKFDGQVWPFLHVLSSATSNDENGEPGVDRLQELVGRCSFPQLQAFYKQVVRDNKAGKRMTSSTAFKKISGGTRG